jgi:hypothetical protein
MLTTKIYLLKPQKVPALRDWFSFLATEIDACISELTYEKVFAESAYFLEYGGATLLIYSMDGLDIQPAQINELNTKHHAIMRESIERPLDPELVFQVCLSAEGVQGVV